MNILRLLDVFGNRVKQHTPPGSNRWRSLCRLVHAFARRNRAVRRAAEGTVFRDGAQAPRAPWFMDPFPPSGLSPEDASAEARARALLLRLLAPAQREEFQRRDSFTVQVPGRGRFAILPRRSLNVLDLESGECYCCVTATDVPLSDLMLAQKLLLEHDPEQFFATANCPSDFLFSSAASNGMFGRRQRGAERVNPAAAGEGGVHANGHARR
jgi:hypothetical protein